MFGRTKAMVGGLVAIATLTLAAPSARADALTSDESAQLARGDTVIRSQTIERGDHRYVGGVTYTVLDATPEEVDAIFDDVATWQRILPRTKAATKVGERGGDALVELRQGSSFFETSYTIRLRRTADGVRFWLDPSRAHGIDDAWGFFRLTPIGGSATPRVLVTCGVLVDMGDGLGRALFEERVREATFGVPQRLRGYVASLRRREPQRVTMR